MAEPKKSLAYAELNNNIFDEAYMKENISAKCYKYVQRALSSAHS